MRQETVKTDKVACCARCQAADKVNRAASRQQLPMLEVRQTSQPLLCLLVMQRPGEQLKMEMRPDHPCP
jgi:hypothetical protein